MIPFETILRGLSFLWGGALGLFYFGGLWWTVQSLPRRSHPKLWLGLSFSIRTLCTLSGFWVMLKKDLPSFFITLGTFFLVRFFLTRKLGLVK